MTAYHPPVTRLPRMHPCRFTDRSASLTANYTSPLLAPAPPRTARWLNSRCGKRKLGNLYHLVRKYQICRIGWADT
jgi:hypothetical protein